MWRIIFSVFLSHLTYSQVDSVFFDANGQFRYEGKCFNSMKIGNWNEYSVANNRITRVFEMIENDTFKIIYPYEDSLVNAFSYGYFDANQVVVNGIFYFENLRTNIKIEGQYSQNNKIGLWTTYNNNQLKMVENYHFEKRTVYFYNNNKLEEISQFNHRKSFSERDGMFVLFDTNCIISLIGQFKENCQVGEWSFFENGKIISRGSYYPDFLTYMVIDNTMFVVNKDNIKADKIYSNEVINEFKKIHKATSTQILYLKDGWWCFFENDKVIRKELYRKGVLIRSKKQFDIRI